MVGFEIYLTESQTKVTIMTGATRDPVQNGYVN